MEVNCKVNVVNRLLPTAGQSGPSRLIWANVTLSRNKSEVVELTLTTSRNKTGTKYRVTNNVEQIFAKFIAQGKLTIRFTQPQHDLCFSGDCKQVEKILHVLKGGELRKNSLAAVLPNASAKVVIPKTKMLITSRAEYPVTTNFPDTLVTLKINNIQLKKIDRRILQLKNLEILDLSNNQISNLPESVSSLPRLKQLNMSHNHIKRVPETLCKSCSHITLLDLSSNNLTVLPDSVCSMVSLHTLKLDRNHLRSLPRTICKLRSLRVLTFSSNQLPWLPASFQTFDLDHIDVSGNPFEERKEVKMLSKASTLLTSLLSLAAKTVIRCRLRYVEGEVPLTLISYLNEASTVCPCGKICMDDGITSNGSLDLRKVSESFIGDKFVPLELTLCSVNCFNRYALSLLS